MIAKKVWFAKIIFAKTHRHSVKTVLIVAAAPAIIVKHTSAMVSRINVLNRAPSPVPPMQTVPAVQVVMAAAAATVKDNAFHWVSVRPKLKKQIVQRVKFVTIIWSACPHLHA